MRDAWSRKSSLQASKHICRILEILLIYITTLASHRQIVILFLFSSSNSFSRELLVLAVKFTHCVKPLTWTSSHSSLGHETAALPAICLYVFHINTPKTGWMTRQKCCHPKHFAYLAGILQDATGWINSSRHFP